MTPKAQFSRRASSDSSTSVPHTQSLHPTPHFRSFKQSPVPHIHHQIHLASIHNGSISRTAFVTLHSLHSHHPAYHSLRKSRHLLAVIMSASSSASTGGAAPAGTAQDNTAAYRIARPSTPPVDINNTEVDNQVVPGAPRRPNHGR
jgi:hypothetical protein